MRQPVRRQSILRIGSLPRWLVLLASLSLLGTLMGMLRTRGGPVGGAIDWPGETSLVLGFLLLAAYLAGSFSSDVGLPRITGYLLAGVLVGPDAAGLLRSGDVERLRALDDIAISLIALAAGGQLRVSELRRRARTVLGIMSAEMCAVFLAVGGFIALAAPALPFVRGASGTETAVLALVFASVAISNSPAVAIAVINDAKAEGPVASTILSVAILKDVVVIAFFAVALSVGRAVVGGGGPGWAFAGEIALAIPGSLLAGAAVGWVISTYLRRVRVRLVLFTLAIAFVNARLASALHLEVLLLSLSAGFFVENLSPAEGEPFIRAIEHNSAPLYALFFGLAGASLDLGALAEMGPVVLALVAVRATAVYLGTWVGAKAVGAEPDVRRHAWTGFISQAGITLGMVVIAARACPAWSELFTTLFVAMVAVHELGGPVLLMDGLRRSGEIARARSGAPAWPD